MTTKLIKLRLQWPNITKEHSLKKKKIKPENSPDNKTVAAHKNECNKTNKNIDRKRERKGKSEFQSYYIVIFKFPAHNNKRVMKREKDEENMSDT